MKIIHKIKDRENGCPVGHKCDDCNIYLPLYKETQGGEVIAEYNCTLNNLAVLMSEQKERTMGVQAAVEQRGNDMVERQDQFLSLVKRKALEKG